MEDKERIELLEKENQELKEKNKKLLELYESFKRLSNYPDIYKFLCMNINKNIRCFLEQGNNNIPIFEIEIPEELQYEKQKN